MSDDFKQVDLTETRIYPIWGIVLEQVFKRSDEENISFFEAFDSYIYPNCEYSLSKDYTEYYDVINKDEYMPLLKNKENGYLIDFDFSLEDPTTKDIFYLTNQDILLCPNGKIIKFD